MQIIKTIAKPIIWTHMPWKWPKRATKAIRGAAAKAWERLTAGRRSLKIISRLTPSKTAETQFLLQALETKLEKEIDGFFAADYRTTRTPELFKVTTKARQIWLQYSARLKLFISHPERMVGRDEFARQMQRIEGGKSPQPYAEFFDRNGKTDSNFWLETRRFLAELDSTAATGPNHQELNAKFRELSREIGRGFEGIFRK